MFFTEHNVNLEKRIAEEKTTLFLGATPNYHTKAAAYANKTCSYTYPVFAYQRDENKSRTTRFVQVGLAVPK
ncbi:hypothetical protein [Leeuwenhoekiella sp. LLG6367-2.1]|uniref:hypothetical protein n=1 Tax=Leeuwenhoekiella sp. LLG6367-2.1 TaxID=3160833 RepID=UPI00386C2CF6